MKNCIIIILFVLFSLNGFSQNVGIGTTDPQAQLHTTADVILGGLTNDNTQSKIVVQDAPGKLSWRDAGTLTNYYWCLTGNGGTGVNNFLGTTDNKALIIKTNNQQRVQINTSADNSNLMGGVVEISVDSLKVNGAGLAIYRKGNVNRWGTSIEFLMNNSIGEKKFYARINGGIQSNIAGQENGLIAFEVATNGQLGVQTQQVKMVITSEGFVGIGKLFPTAQLHTSESVKFEGLTNDDNLSKVLVQDNTGLLFWRNASTIGNTYNTWNLVGNSGTNSSTNFIGTTDQNPVIIKTNNQQRLQINTSINNANPMGGVMEVSVDSLKVNGAGLSIYRKGNVNRWGTSVEFLMNNSAGQKKFYSRINGGIQSNIAGQENGLIAFEVATNGQLGVHTEQVKMVITSEGYVGIGELFPTAQLHTKESVRFEGMTNNNNLTKILVQDNTGLLFWRDASTIGSGANTWNLSGNTGTNSATNFLGTTDQNPIVIKANNQQRVQINTESVNSNLMGGVVDIITDSLKVNGCGLGLYRKGNVNGWGSSLEFQLNNSQGQKKFYARINGGIESNIAGNENGVISFEVATNGQLGVNTQQIKMVITSQGFVGLGVSAPSAQLHTTATVRFQNLPSGTGNYLLIDGNGNVYRSSQAPTSSIGVNDNFVNLQKEIEDLRKLVTELQNEIKKNYTSKN